MTDLHTLISLQRLCSTINTSSAQPLSPPHRHFFPAVSTFMDHPGPVDDNKPRRRLNMGMRTAPARLPRHRRLVPRIVQDSRDVPVEALMFAALESMEDWFDPVWHTLAQYFGTPEEDTAVGTRTVSLGLGITVHVVDENASWTECMRAVAQLLIVLSVFRDHVANGVFMKWGPQSTLMEFFPVTAHVLKNAV
ncbi:hypothetical protein EDB86DRAFT_2832727 [Lactarius hatsudake]|nr:hypothetical protein EDB86DRAFT_2832727 [Lactarius hatsudake]